MAKYKGKISGRKAGSVRYDAVYETMTFYFTQEQVLQALGFSKAKWNWGSIRCDGINKVVVEMNKKVWPDTTEKEAS